MKNFVLNIGRHLESYVNENKFNLYLKPTDK
jgi:hypothetical protein